MNISYNKRAALHIQETATQYSEISSLLRLDFLAEVKKVIMDIQFMPECWPIVEGSIRKALLTRFPYLIYYRILPNETVRILSVHHQRRNPDLGKNRL